MPENKPSINAKKVDIDVWENTDARGGELFLVSDRFKRFRMSSGLVDHLKIEGAPYKAYLAYDKANQRVMVGPVDAVTLPSGQERAKSITFDAGRHYATVRGFFDKHMLPAEKRRYIYEGMWNGWFTFRRGD